MHHSGVTEEICAIRLAKRKEALSLSRGNFLRRYFLHKMILNFSVAGRAILHVGGHRRLRSAHPKRPAPIQASPARALPKLSLLAPRSGRRDDRLCGLLHPRQSFLAEFLVTHRAVHRLGRARLPRKSSVTQANGHLRPKGSAGSGARHCS